jgi:hypothetical protein
MTWSYRGSPMETRMIERAFPTFAKLPRLMLRVFRVLTGSRVVMLLSLSLLGRAALALLVAGSGDRVMVPAMATSQTQVGLIRKLGPPWPTGNCFTVSTRPLMGGRLSGPRTGELSVCNMNAENFQSIVGQLGLRTVEIELIDEYHCLISDPKIPRVWLLESPCQVCLSTHPGARQIVRCSKSFLPHPVD